MFLEGFIAGFGLSFLILVSFYINYKIKRKKELELQKKKDRILSEALHVYSIYKEISKPKIETYNSEFEGYFHDKKDQENSL
jgi:hypothetical protein